jgi:antitoxin component YwqK of YwqJK toxin-antitoxin module
MRPCFRFLAPVLFPSLLAACARDSGTRETHWPSGAVHERWTVKQGTEVKHGPYTAWNEAGRLLAEGQFSDGAESGRWTLWYGTEPNVKRREGTYVGGLPDGLWQGWMDPHHSHDHGGHAVPSEGPSPAPHVHPAPGGHPPPRVEETYRRGVPHGAWRSWHADGSLADTSYYIDGKLEGLVLSYHPNGQQALEVEYRDGERLGRQTVWNEAGEVVDVID